MFRVEFEERNICPIVDESSLTCRINFETCRGNYAKRPKSCPAIKISNEPKGLKDSPVEVQPHVYIEKYNCMNCSQMQVCPLAEEIADAKGAVVCATWSPVEERPIVKDGFFDCKFKDGEDYVEGSFYGMRDGWAIVSRYKSLNAEWVKAQNIVDIWRSEE